MRKQLLGAGLLGGLIVLGAGGVAASAAQPTHTINACVINGNGLVRIIDPAQGQTCRDGFETPTFWNQTGPQGPAGPKGDPGAQGPAGPAGPSGVSGYEVVQGAILEYPGQTAFAHAFCPGDKLVVGGGWETLDSSSQHTWQVLSSIPVDQDRWTTQLFNSGPGPHRVRGYAICIDA